MNPLDTYDREGILPLAGGYLPLVSIDAQSISSLWGKAIKIIHKHGAPHVPDYGTLTKRIHLTARVKDVHNNQASPLLPFGEKSREKYNSELTKEYSDYWNSLSLEDKKRFEYCYADLLFDYGEQHLNTLQANVRNLRAGSRRHVGVLWDNTVHIPSYEDQPCWIAYKLEVMDESSVRLIIVYRSWDVFGGLPANLPAICYGVEKVLAEENTGMTIGELIVTGMDAHIYDTDMDLVELILSEYDICVKCGELKPKTSLMLRDTGKICAECYGGKK